MAKRSKLSEYKHFKKLSNEWWSEKGKYKILHKIKHIRMEYILNFIDSQKLKNFKILDIGCGGGLISESLAKLGAKVTGIDFVENNIKEAKSHALKKKLKIDYYVQDLENLNLNNKFDLIILFEVLEHLNNWDKSLIKIKKFLKKNGILIISTINKNFLSNILAIKIAENFLNWVPKNTHDYNKFITPKELEIFLKKENFSIVDISGLVFNPITNEWKLNKYNKLVNYFCTAKLN